MLNYLQKRFALSEQGAKDFIKGSLYCAISDISLMVPLGLLVVVLDALLEPILGVQTGRPPDIVFYTVVGLLILGFMFICHWYQYTSVFVSTYSESATRRISLAEKLRHLPPSYFGKKDLSDLTNTIMGDCATLEHAFSHAIPQLVGASISTVLVGIGLLIFDWQMGLALLWVVPVALAIILGSKKMQESGVRKHYDAKRACADGIQECLETVRDIKSYNQEETYLAGLNRKLDEAERAQISSELVAGISVKSAEMVLKLGLATTILVGSGMLISGRTDLLVFLIFLIAASRIYDPLTGILAYIAEIIHADVPINRMNEILQHPVQEGVEEYSTDGYDIVFDHVGFSYNEGEPVLGDVSFTAKQGEVTALVGPSGGGKSTATKLAARFWDPERGTITLGGVDISKVDPEALLRNYAIVFQDVVLFDDTVMENIRLGRKGATDEEVMAAGRSAMCDEFVSRLPQGYQTVIGENGSMLSGGERQRISIARALLKDAPVVLLDEATASLDVENETRIQTAISQLIKEKTVLVIAHRMRTVANADKIVVLDDGCVAQQGSSDELLEQGGLYRHMVGLQRQSMDWSI
ncbi:ABC transporter ATP-binding protein [Methanoculleus bourgensis]|uniref:ABC transporter ATP-binding protein n=1 Tax=Methanoculleus bourgensis TaxID=83986 RepID=UPI0022EF74EA|nr:ABC transporter ATP-binding protein [Methanoculleus bourgensis]GLI47172.1 ABC transporter ATP-binding protein [Methanoculleus bourgensis]